MFDLKITAFRIFVPDVADAVPFYRDILGLAPRAMADDDGFAVFDAGIMLILEPVGVEPSLTGRFTGISLEVADMDAAYQHLRGLGVEFTDAPHKQGWGGTLAHFKDPAGNTLTIVEYPKN